MIAAVSVADMSLQAELAGMDLEAGLRRDAEQVLQVGAKAIEGSDAWVDQALVARSAGLGLHALAERESAELIVVGASHRRHPAGVPGSTAMRLVHGAPCSVAVARGLSRATDTRLKRIGVGFDGGDEAKLALSSAAELTRRSGGTLHALAVFAKPAPANPMFAVTTHGYGEIVAAMRDQLRRELDDAVSSLAGEVTVEAEVVDGDPAAVLAARSRTLDVLFMGSRGYGPYGRRSREASRPASPRSRRARSSSCRAACNAPSRPARPSSLRRAHVPERDRGRAVIDLHCHILPGLDDGARDLDDAVAMAGQAQADGIRLVCATPHIRHDHDVLIGELSERVAQLRAAINQAGIGVGVAPGGEVSETIVDALDDEDLERVSLGGGRRWILLEPAAGPLGGSLCAAAARLAQRGYRSLIAHPERHVSADLPERLAELVEQGSLVQATAQHVIDPGTAEGMVELARRGLVHVLGSDAHSSRAGRPVALAAALERLAGIDPVAMHLEWVSLEAPRAIVAGEDLQAPFAPAPQA